MSHLDARPAGTRGVAGRARSAGRVWAVLAVLVATAVHASAALGSGGPVWAEDEIGVVANSYVIAAVGQPWSLSHLAYYPGWSAVIAPLWWLSSEPQVFYRGAVAVSVGFAILTIAPLAALVRRVGIGASGAVVIAAVVSMGPARSVMSNYVLTENFLAFMVALTAVAAVRYFEAPSAGRAVALASATAYSFFTHGRALPLVGATVVAFLLAKGGRSRRPGIIGAAAALLLTVVAYVAYTGVVGQVYSDSTGREAGALSHLLAASGPGWARSFIGQAWYQLAAWFGLTLLGLLAIVSTALKEVRRRVPGVGLWAGLAYAGLLLLTVGFLARGMANAPGVTRLDYWFYGRYLDPFTLPLAALGLALVVSGRSRPLLRPVLAISTVVSVAFVLVNLREIGPDYPIAVINAGGLLLWSLIPGVLPSIPLIASVLAVTALILFASDRPALRRRMVPALAVFFLGSSLIVDQHVVDPFNSSWRGDGASLREVVERVSDDGEGIAFDLAGSTRGEDNRIVFWLSPRRIERFVSESAPPPHDLVIARNEWPGGLSMGARKVASMRRPDNALWVMPGHRQEELARSGLLERPPSDLELRSYEFEMALEPSWDGVSCEVRGGCHVHAVLTNAGRDVWTPLGTRQANEGSVRVVAWWMSGDQAVPQVWDLPTSVLPGQSLDLDLHLTPPDGIPTGPSTVSFGLVHEGFGAFPPPRVEPSSLVLVVDPLG